MIYGYLTSLATFELALQTAAHTQMRLCHPGCRRAISITLPRRQHHARAQPTGRDTGVPGPS